MIRPPARVIAKRCTPPDNRTSVFFRAVSQGGSQHAIYLIAPGSPSALPSILRTSAFKAHLKKHGEQYLEIFKRKDTSAKAGRSTGIEEERATIQSFDQVNTLPSLTDAWGSFLSLPEDACRVIDTSFVQELTFGHVTTAVSMGMQGGLSPGPSCGSPLVFSPCPRISPGRDTGYSLSPPRASPLTSSRYSSPMLPTPALTPVFTGLEFAGDIGVQMNPCLAATRDWTQVYWQDTGTQLVG